MAKIYGYNDAVDFAAKNLITFNGSFARGAGQPLDKTAVWYPKDGVSGYDRAAAYAATEAAYVGQELAVIDVVYAEDGTTVTGTTVKFYGIQDAAGTLKELGAVPVGDESTIEVDNEGRISLKGISEQVFERDILGEDGEPTGEKEQVRYQPLLTSEGLVWVEPSKTTVEGLATLIEALDSKVTQLTGNVNSNATAITAEANARIAADKVITDSIGEVAEGKTIVSMIEDAVKAAKDYADEKDIETSYNDKDIKDRVKAIEDDYLKAADKYNDSEIKADIADHTSRIGAIESAIGDPTNGILKNIEANAQAITAEAEARAQGDTDTLDAAKSYTNDEIIGLEIAIEKKTVSEVESDYIVIKNKAGTEVASVNAAKFVKDGMLDKAEYDKDAKKLTLTWNTDAGKNATEIDLNDLIDTYTGSEHIIVSADGKITLGESVALDADITALDTKLSTEIAKKRTEVEVDAQIDAKITAADLGQYAVKATVEAALEAKADKETFESHTESYNEFVESYNTDKATFATKTELADKLDVSQYNNDMATVVTTTAMESALTPVSQRISNVETTVQNNAAAVTETLKDYAKTSEVTETLTNYYTKSEVYTQSETDSKIDAKIASFTGGESAADVKLALESYRDAINQELWGSDAAGWTTTVDADGKTKVVYDPKYGNNSRIDILENKVSQVESTNEAQGSSITKNTNDITTLGNNVKQLQDGLSTVSNAYTSLNTEVTTKISPRLSAVETTLNGAEGSTGLISTVAEHTTEISNLKAKDSELASLIQGNTDKFKDYYTSSQVDKKLEDAVGGIDFSDFVTDSEFAAYQTTVSTELGKKAVATEVAATFETVNAEIAKKADASKVYSKTDAEATFVKSADLESLIDTRVNTLIDGANSEDTIKNVTNLVEFVNNNADVVAQLVTDVKANGEALGSQATLIAANDTAIKANAAAIEALGTVVTEGLADVKVHESTEISVTARTSENEGGIMLGLKQVSVSKLVQTADDVLILNGGNATV